MLPAHLLLREATGLLKVDRFFTSVAVLSRLDHHFCCQKKTCSSRILDDMDVMQWCDFYMWSRYVQIYSYMLYLYVADNVDLLSALFGLCGIHHEIPRKGRSELGETSGNIRMPTYANWARVLHFMLCCFAVVSV